MTHPLSSTLTDAICDATANYVVARLIAHVDAFDPVVRDYRVNQAIAGLRDVAMLGAEELVHYQRIVANKAGEQLATAVRLSREALEVPGGHRVWFGALQDQVDNLLIRAMADHANGNDNNPLPLLIAQTMLAAVVHARGLLGITIKGPAKRRATAMRPFEPADYPTSEIRSAIVDMAFGADPTAVEVLQAASGNPAHDRNGRITLLLAAHAGTADEQAAVRELAGQIIAAEPHRFTVSTTAAPQSARLGLVAQARAAAERD